MVTIETAYTTTEDGFDIAFATIGTGPLMVFVAEDGGGLYCHEAFPGWGRFMDRLAEKRRLLLFDWRGRGSSPKDSATSSE